jgi:hypothetical protein
MCARECVLARHVRTQMWACLEPLRTMYAYYARATVRVHVFT